MISWSEPRLVCDCRSKVYWMAEDDLGRVAAVGGQLCVIAPDSSRVREHPYRGLSFGAFVDREIVTAAECGTVPMLFVGDRPRIALPIPKLEVFGSSYVAAERRLYFINGGSLVEVDLVTERAAVVADGLFEGEGSSHPQYERVVAGPGLVALHQYGLRVWQGRQLRLVVDDPLYSHVAILPGGSLLTASDSEVIHWRDGRSLDVVGEARAPGKFLYFLGAVGETPVVVWSEGSKGAWFGLVEPGGVTGEIYEHIYAECCAVLDEDRALAIGTLDGDILTWDIDRRSIDRLALPDPDRIVELQWSTASRRLFIGTRDGLVYCTEPS